MTKAVQKTKTSKKGENMISRTECRLRNAYAAAPITVFPSFNQDGSPDLDNFRGVLTVYCNTQGTDRDGQPKTYPNRYEIGLKGKQLQGLAAHVMEGKQFNELVCLAYVDNEGAWKIDKKTGSPVKDKSGKQIMEGVIKLHLQSYDLGADPEAVEFENGMKKVNGAINDGRVRPGITMDDAKAMIKLFMEGRRIKAKAQPFVTSEVRAAGHWGYANVWTEELKHWHMATPGNYQQAAPAGNPPAPAGVTPEMLAAAMAMMANMAQPGQTPQAPPSAQPAAEQPVQAAQAAQTDYNGVEPEDGGEMDDEIPF